MSKYTYKELVKQAQKCKKNVETEYRLGMNSRWAYYFAKAIIKPKTDIKRITFDEVTDPLGNYVSNQIYKSDYMDMANRLIKYVEKYHLMPKYVRWNAEKKIHPHLVTYMFSRILVYLNKNGAYPKYANVNSKCFTKPTETGNEVYDYACKKYGRKFTSLDDILEFVANYFGYLGYYDDVKSNQEVTDSYAGNCVDLLQWLCNMVEPLGYEWKCVHVSCRVSGTGHVWGKFRHSKNTGGEWINRDPAAVASNGDIYSMWCEDGYVEAYNPDWWLENLHR